MPLAIGAWLTILGYTLSVYGIDLWMGKPQSLPYLLGLSQTKIDYVGATPTTPTVSTRPGGATGGLNEPGPGTK